MKLIIEARFEHELSMHGQADVKRAVQELRETIEAVGGEVTQADLTADRGDTR